jgi:hypothetical protein
MPVPRPPESSTLNLDSKSEVASPDDTGPNKNENPDFSTREATERRRITQPELNVLYRDMDFPKTKAQLLGSRLKQWNLFEKL